MDRSVSISLYIYVYIYIHIYIYANCACVRNACYVAERIHISRGQQEFTGIGSIFEISDTIARMRTLDHNILNSRGLYSTVESLGHPACMVSFVRQ